MKRGFYTIMAAQFFSSLADNALLIAAIALLEEISAPGWMTPLLKLFFVLSYVVLAAFVGAFADSLPKRKVMLITNMIKILGCISMFVGLHPLMAYGIVGLGAAAYSPAKYGILTELLPPAKLVEANGWIEGLTVLSIIFGAVLGGALISPQFAHLLASWHVPALSHLISPRVQSALIVIALLYVMAGIFNLRILDTGARYPHQTRNPARLMVDFANCCDVLWRDKLGQISLAVTTLFWGAGATLQFIVLRWAEHALGMPLDKATKLQGVVALGVAFGAIAAARFIPLKKSLSVMPMGIAMGLLVTSMTMVHNVWLAYPLLVAIGALAGFFVVPMNALLQHRGHVLMSAGHSIAVQNFNENLSILTMLAIYSVMLKVNLNINVVIIMFGVLVAGCMYCVMRWHRANQAKHDTLALIRDYD